MVAIEERPCCEKPVNEEEDDKVEVEKQHCKVETLAADELFPEEESQFTWRAAFLGAFLGCFVGKQ